MSKSDIKRFAVMQGETVTTRASHPWGSIYHCWKCDAVFELKKEDLKNDAHNKGHTCGGATTHPHLAGGHRQR